jgi:hypothetical protein
MVDWPVLFYKNAPVETGADCMRKYYSIACILIIIAYTNCKNWRKTTGAVLAVYDAVVTQLL